MSNSNNKILNNTNANNTNIQKDRNPRPVHLPSETGGKTKHSTEKFYFGANAPNRRPQNRRPGQNQFQQRNAQNNSDGNVQAVSQTSN